MKRRYALRSIWGYISMPGKALWKATHSTTKDRLIQIFVGFGVSTWMQSPHQTARDMLLAALQIRFIRASLPGLIPDSSLPAPATTATLYAAIRTRNGPGNVPLQQFGAEIARLNIRLHVIFWNPPAPWQKQIGNAVHLADDAHVADFANYIAAHLLYLRDQSVTPAAVELTNEPNGVWNTQFTPEQYDQLVFLTRQALDDAGLQAIPIEGPGTSNRPGDFLRVLRKTGHIKLLGAYSFHEYDSRTGLEPAGLSVIRPALAGLPPLPIVVTEFSDAAPRWQHLAAPYAGRDPSFDPDFGIAVAGEALQLIADGANEILVWHLEDLPWMHGSSGLIDRAGNVKPLGQALVAVFGLVAPGSQVRIPPHPVPHTPVVVFQTATEATVCAVNLGTAPVSARFKIAGLPRLGTRTDRRLFGGEIGINNDTVANIQAGSDGVGLYLPPRSSLAALFNLV